jgi:hypothetical protein
LANAPLERRIAKQRAVSTGEVKLIEAVTAYGIERLQHDPEFAGRAVGKYFDQIFQKQANKDQVLLEALQDLRNEPPNEAASTAGKTELNEEFLNRFEQYAEGASTEQLRQKWGRVLSAEVRSPATFSAKVLRIVDEIDAETAASFEEVCKSSFYNVIPKCLTGALEFGRLSKLGMSGLIIDPGIAGHLSEYFGGKDGEQALWITRSPEHAVAIPKGTYLPAINPTSTAPLMDHSGTPAIPCYLLTDAGAAIAEIFSRADAFARYIAKLREALPVVALIEYSVLANGAFSRRT